jgi:hypothetical protein
MPARPQETELRGAPSLACETMRRQPTQDKKRSITQAATTPWVEFPHELSWLWFMAMP